MRRYTARQYGAMMRQQGLNWPAPTIGPDDLSLPTVRVYRIGRRKVADVIVFVRKDWATVYARPSYDGYRAAYEAVHPRAATGRDVDHLHPKSQAAPQDYCALGVMSAALNRSWNDAEDADSVSQKLYNIPRDRPHRFTSTQTDMERGWAVVSGFLTPFLEIDTAPLTLQTGEQIKAALEG